MSGKVCVFGSFNCDMVARVERFPVPGESLVASGSMTSAGGKGAKRHLSFSRGGAVDPQRHAHRHPDGWRT